MEKHNLTLGSLFDGSGGFPLAGLISGVTPIWASEVEPFPIRVTTKRLPQVKHYGDVSQMDGGKIEPVDIITFGSPCQDMSIAGKREGLEGSRSSLFYEAIRIVREMREATNGEYPKYIIWENVTGAFSSNKGEDFRCVLESICRVKNPSATVPSAAKWEQSGKIVGSDYSVAWRVLDAQYWGVPQRRKRIYLVADFDGLCAGKILFESEGLSGHPFEGFKAWKGTAGGAKSGARTAGGICLNDQGGQRMDITEDVTATLRAEAHHPPVVMGSAGFCTEHSEKSRSIGYEEEKSPTLRAGVVPAALMFENHSQDTRYTGPLDTSQTVLATFGTGGNNQPLVVQEPKTFDVRFTSEGTRNARQNCYETDTARTIDTGGNAPDSNQGGVAVVEVKAYGISSDKSNAMLSDNPHAGIYEAETSRTLDTKCADPGCNQGGIAVVAIEGNGTRPSHKGNGYSEENVSYTLNATEQHGVAYGIDRATYNMGQNAQFGLAIEEEVEPTMVAKGPGAVAHPVYTTSKNSYHTEAEEDVANTLVATDYKDPPTVTEEPYYIVRRLTPTECARLQGFPDWWCSDLGMEKPTDEELTFWRDVFETHRRVVTGAAKPKTDKQIVKWLSDPHTDSAEYKMWGNGIALPCAVFVLSGIVYYSQFQGE
jgi:DNA (cytosine-5)-methyltransferase 1